MYFLQHFTGSRVLYIEKPRFICLDQINGQSNRSHSDDQPKVARRPASTGASRDTKQEDPPSSHEDGHLTFDTFDFG